MTSNGKRKKLHKHQLNRAKDYKKIVKIKIPDRIDTKKIVDELWYIVWEKNLLKPKIFKYSFVSDLFAITFCERHLKDKPYFIIRGKELKEYGKDKVDYRLRQTGQKTENTLPYKYNFPEGLSIQRKKTLRTMYRRNLRRSLYKLYIKNSNNEKMYVLDKIEEKPASFFKKLKKPWFNELVISVTFKKWLYEEQGWMIDDIMKEVKYYPAKAAKIASIVEVLREDYPDVDFDYKDDTYTSLAIQLFNTYEKRILKYFEKKNAIPKLALCNAEEAYVELVMRGFLPPGLLSKPLDEKKHTFIKTFNNKLPPLYFPKVVDKDISNSAPELMYNFGLTGWTGINYQKTFK